MVVVVEEALGLLGGLASKTALLVSSPPAITNSEDQMRRLANMEKSN